MKWLVLVSLFLAGCAARPLNPGAGIEVHVVPRGWLTKKAVASGAVAPGQDCIGLSSLRERRIYIAADLDRKQMCAVAMHEVGHFIYRRTEDERVWEVLGALDAPGFPSRRDGP